MIELIKPLKEKLVFYGPLNVQSKFLVFSTIVILFMISWRLTTLLFRSVVILLLERLCFLRIKSKKENAIKFKQKELQQISKSTSNVIDLNQQTSDFHCLNKAIYLKEKGIILTNSLYALVDTIFIGGLGVFHFSVASYLF